LTQSSQLLAATAQGVFRLDLSHLNLVIPQLAIEVSGQSALLSWPASAGAFSLQSAPSPDAPVPWATVANPAILTNGSRIVTVDLANAERFFRLFSP
jgi:hypothetical protein